MGQNLFTYIAVVLGEAVFRKVLQRVVQKEKTSNQADYLQSREKVSYRFYLSWCQELSFALFRHLPVCDRTAMSVENCLCPVSHTMSVSEFPTLRGTAVGPAGDVLFCIEVLLRPHKSAEVLSKTWNLPTTGLKSLEGYFWKVNSGFGTNCSYTVR